MAFGFYSDATLTTLLYSGNPINVTQDTAGSIPAVDVQVWFGNPTSGTTARAASNPGVDQVQVLINDSYTGGGATASMFKLALTQAGLATATAGAALNLGTTVNGGSSNAKIVWIRISDASGVAGYKTDVDIRTNTLQLT